MCWFFYACTAYEVHRLVTTFGLFIVIPVSIVIGLLVIQNGRHLGASRRETSPSTGLTLAEVDELLAVMPELSDETKKTISYVLAGRVREKEKPR